MSFDQNLPPSSDDVDLMIEAKEKGTRIRWVDTKQSGSDHERVEQAVFQLYKLFDLYPVDDDVWIANKKIIPKSVKANKRKKAVAVKVQDDAIVEENTIVEEEEEMIIGMRTRSRSRKKTKKTQTCTIMTLYWFKSFFVYDEQGAY